MMGREKEYVVASATVSETRWFIRAEFTSSSGPQSLVRLAIELGLHNAPTGKALFSKEECQHRICRWTIASDSNAVPPHRVLLELV